MRREKELLEILEAEEQSSRQEESPAVVAEAKNSLEHVAEILQEYRGGIKLGPANNIENALTTAYFGRQTWDMENVLPRILLAEAAQGVLNKRYDAGQDLAQLAIRIAADVYHDMFSTLCQQTYLSSNKSKGRERKKIEQESEAKTIETYLAPVEPMLAAAHYLSQVKGFEDAVMRCEDREDLCAVSAAKTYYDLIPTKTGKEAILAEMKNSATEPKSLFLYSVMIMHKEFLNYFESGGETK